MSWNASRPADSDRIRLSANLLRNNFQAIELGNVPYDTLSLQSQAVLPALAGHNRLYGYGNANSGQVELASVNPTGATVRLTEGGKVGSIGQNAIFGNIQCANLSFDNSYFYSGALMVTARASSAANGTTSMNVNLSVTRTNTGRYTLTVPAGVLTVNSYQVLIQVQYNGAQDSMFADINSKPNVNPANPTLITIETIYRADGTRRDTPFDVIIVGGR